MAGHGEDMLREGLERQVGGPGGARGRVAGKQW